MKKQIMPSDTAKIIGYSVFVIIVFVVSLLAHTFAYFFLSTILMLVAMRNIEKILVKTDNSRK